MQSRERAALRFAFAALSALLSCGTPACRSSTPRPNADPVVIRVPGGPALDEASVRFEPPGHVHAARLDEAGNLSLSTDGAAFTVHLPESCPVSVPKGAGPTPILARPLLRIEGDTAQVGYGASFELTATLGCPAEGDHVTWRQTEGPPLADVGVLEAGRKFRARTLPRSHFLPDPLPHGVVALSPRTQGRYVLEATLSRNRRPTIRRVVTVTSIARATGLSSVAVSERVLLGGSGWRLEGAPPRSHAHLETAEGAAMLTPDVAGRFTLVDAEGNRKTLQALTHDRTPLDCGRAECHATVSALSLSTPMSNALALTVEKSESPSCLFECHVVGERGLDDGGFVDVMGKLGFRFPGRPSFEGLPHALQRLGGVRCTSCHGPGAIPEKQDRARVLRAAVCATCHDAPPAYTHVQAWERSAMARSDSAPETRTTRACARCHTTGGFLDAIGVRRRADASRDPDDAIVGVSCAACHAVHGPHVGALIRTVAPPPTLGTGVVQHDAGPSSVCLTCHAPAPDETLPSASVAVLVQGRARLPAALGEVEESGPSPHALPGGCIACHGATPKGRGTDHGFSVDPATCTTCHTKGVPRERPDSSGRTLGSRATELLARLMSRCAPKDAPEILHAHADASATCKLSREQARALYDVALVVEDRAAAIHNAPFSRILLDRAEAVLAAGPASRGKPRQVP